MNIVSIKESGSNNILRWSIEHGAEIFTDTALQSIVNNDLCYLITLSDVSFLELFRLTQMYREKLRIIKEELAQTPPRTALVKSFAGNITVTKGDKEESISMVEAVDYICKSFLNLVLQMQTDSDIIPSKALRLFLPMITRRFTVQIPFGFVDFIRSIKAEEAPMIFNKDYPATLNQVIENPEHTFQKIFTLGYVKSTSIITYQKQYDKYLNVFKYQVIKPTKETVNDLFKVGLLGFHCFDPVSRGETRCTMFNCDKDTLTKSMAEFKYIDFNNTPLYFDFCIELPIQYMQILCNSYSHEVLTISCESSMANIINTGLDYNDFIIPEFKGKSELTEEEQKVIDDTTAHIEEYRIRISEANTLLLNTLEAILLDEDDKINVTEAFAMLPCIYKAKAVITVDTSLLDSYKNHSDEVISAMFDTISNIVNSVASDIKTMNVDESK